MRDSNPRYAFTYATLAVWCLRPLSQSSIAPDFHKQRCLINNDKKRIITMIETYWSFWIDSNYRPHH